MVSIRTSHAALAAKVEQVQLGPMNDPSLSPSRMRISARPHRSIADVMPMRQYADLRSAARRRHQAALLADAGRQGRDAERQARDSEPPDCQKLLLLGVGQTGRAHDGGVMGCVPSQHE